MLCNKPVLSVGIAGMNYGFIMPREALDLAAYQIVLEPAVIYHFIT
jgi:hypothetical protein